MKQFFALHEDENGRGMEQKPQPVGDLVEDGKRLRRVLRVGIGIGPSGGEVEEFQKSLLERLKMRLDLESGIALVSYQLAPSRLA